MCLQMRPANTQNLLYSLSDIFSKEQHSLIVMLILDQRIKTGSNRFQMSDTTHYHLQVQANPKKIVQKNQFYF